MTKFEFEQEFYEYVTDMCGHAPIPKVRCVIDGHSMYLDEYRVRYLQVKCMKAAQAGNFEEFTKRHKVFSADGYPMHFLENGLFREKFESGFYDVTAKLHMQLLANIRNQQQS